MYTPYIWCFQINYYPMNSLTYHNQQILNIIIEFGSEFGHEMISDPQIIKCFSDLNKLAKKKSWKLNK